MRTNRVMTVITVLILLALALAYALPKLPRKAAEAQKTAENRKTEETVGGETEDSMVWFDYTANGNIYIGEDVPEGVYTISAGNGISILQLCENGTIVEKWTLSCDEGYEREISDVTLKTGQILISRGSEAWRMSGRFSPSELPKPASYDENESFTAVEKVELAEGSYTVGGKIPPGIYRIHSMEQENVVHVSSDHPLEGGIDADIYPASRFGYCTSYGGVKLVEGDTLTITGGDVRMFRS